MKLEVKLYHFYHIFADGKWIKPVWQHLRALTKGKLVNNLETFFIGITGSEVNKGRVEKFLKMYSYFFPFQYTLAAHSQEGWEQTTLDKIHDFSLDHEGYVLYAHTKGAFNDREPNPSWRKSMTYFNVLKWGKAVEELKEHQAVGCHWLLPEDLPVNGYYFAGNFWWANLSLIRTFDKPLKNNRYDAESWIGMKYETEPFTIYDLNPGFPHRERFKLSW
ncbi:MAG TPA: hypothetical protein VGP47_07095, partial [Parachlamydiaceae bacterium]|nr:hypothetical protein [Parachlamydiaceae bacterium]